MCRVPIARPLPLKRCLKTKRSFPRKNFGETPFFFALKNKPRDRINFKGERKFVATKTAEKILPNVRKKISTKKREDEKRSAVVKITTRRTPEKRSVTVPHGRGPWPREEGWVWKNSVYSNLLVISP